LDVSSAEENDLNGPAEPSVAAPEESSEVLILGTPSSGANKSTDMTNSAIGRDPTDIKVTDPVSYYANRVRAIQLVKDGYWQEARPLLEELTAEFKDDGDTWFILGLTHMGLGHWQEAIEALENALALGTRLFGMPGGGANPNDMMIRLAEAYGQMGDEERAIHGRHQFLSTRQESQFQGV
jgi:tetratricopeptide (TPR) repeat protein